MPAETWIQLEQISLTLSLGLGLAIVWVVMQALKGYAKYVHNLTIMVERLKHDNCDCN